jgi:hypothetical protein
MGTKIDYALLRREIADATRRTFTALREQHPGETFYAFALCTDDDAGTIFPAANSEEGLRRRAEEYAAEGDESIETWMEELRWVPDDWDFGDNEAAHFEGVQQMIDIRWFLKQGKKANERRRQEVLQTFVEALKDVDQDGLFGQDTQREGITVLLWITDPDDEEQLLEWARELNPDAAFERFASAGVEDDEFDQD